MPTNIQNHYTDQVISWDTSDGVYIPKIEDYVQIQMDCGPAMYNDFYSDYTYQAILSNNALVDECVRINYSGESECVICGEIDNDFNDTDELFCVCCGDGLTRCARCGESIECDNEQVIFDDGTVICSSCYDEDFPICEICAEHINTDSSGMFTEEEGLLFTLCDDDSSESPDIPSNIFGSMYHYLICPDCAEEFFVNGKKELTTPHSKRGYNDLISLIPIKRILQPSLLQIPEDYVEKWGLNNNE